MRKLEQYQEVQLTEVTTVWGTGDISNTAQGVSRESELTPARVAAGWPGSTNEHMVQRRWRKKRRYAHHHLTRRAAGRSDLGPWEAGRWADWLWARGTWGSHGDG